MKAEGRAYVTAGVLRVHAALQRTALRETGWRDLSLPLPFISWEPGYILVLFLLAPYDGESDYCALQQPTGRASEGR